MDVALTAYEILIAVILGLILLNTLLNLLGFPLLQRRTVRPTATWQSLPMISVLIPARNEAERIRKCLRSLASQSYPNYEVIVLDDCSTDDTWNVVKDLGFSEEPGVRLQMMRGQALPKGWVGKSWACYQLSRQAQGDYFLFTDADTLHSKYSIESAVALSLKEGAHLLSVWPGQVTISWAEQLVIPLLYVLGIGFVPHWLIHWVQRHRGIAAKLPKRAYHAFGGANGQYLLFTREAYKQLGSHQAVKGELVEDLALGRAVAKRIPEGWRLINCDGRRLVECRMYRNAHEVWYGFSKNIRPAFEGSTFKFCALGAIFLFALTLPFLWIFLRDNRWLVLLQVQLIVLLRLLLTVRFDTSWLGTFLHPFACLFGLAIGANSSRWTRARQIFWRGRQYDPGPMGRS